MERESKVGRERERNGGREEREGERKKATEMESESEPGESGRFSPPLQGGSPVPPPKS